MSEKGYLGDEACINDEVRRAAARLVHATGFWCFHWQPFSWRLTHRVMPADHPIGKALVHLSAVDAQTACFANRKPDPDLFKPLRPTPEHLELFKRSISSIWTGWM